MLLYLDLNCFNRPFDNQSQSRIAEETAAVLEVLQRIVDGTDRLAWSEILAYENSRSPLADRRQEIGTWADRSALVVPVDDTVTARARELNARGLHPLDAAHVASAERAGCEVFLTCDDRLLRRANRTPTSLRLLTPVQYLQGDEHDQDA